MTHARLTVDLDALAANYRKFRERASGGSAAVVKANAYGLGVAPVARRLAAEGCRQFFVATDPEGRELRRILPDAESFDIFVFSGVVEGEDLIPVVNHSGQMRPGPVALHLDTGMHRLGFDDFDAERIPAGTKIRLLMTHLACADAPDHSLNAEQLARFRAFAARFPGVRTSIANSAAILSGVEGIGRPGIGLYGGNPYTAQDNPMRCVATLEGEVLQVRKTPAGVPLGYGATHVTQRDTLIAVVGMGYADGVPRALSNRGQAAFSKIRAPIIGRVSMDLTLVDVTDLPSVQPGDWIEFFGSSVGIDEVAAWAGTISYEILTGIGNRVSRIYVPSRGP